MERHHRDSIIVATLAFAGGTLFAGIIVLGHATLFELITGATGYGWAAVAATLTVGYAANKIAINSGKLKLQDAHLQRMREFHTDTARWTKLRSGVNACRFAYHAAEIMVGKSHDLFRRRPTTVYTYRRILIQFRKALPEARLAHTDVIVSDELHIQLEALDVLIIAVVVGVEEYLALYPAPGSPANRHAQQEFVTLVRTCRNIRDLAAEVGVKIDALRPREPKPL
ncbi:hypothetical protein ICJ04_10585 [Stenotrophomonas sp. 169]|uniref:hypothetical protein n=1 Tax=Stenotrophomonas sp. 169 TaxID=2770322 RepID=UPI00166221DE|nr:hypothetical protein [Stenotrophomonas sp. 169]QNR96012.1 hypothetical protein ICJ04_10585 [Stenotrophomonas sp. 169]